ncbi:M20/M25/M40 family metallo-hydrolase, partial [Microbacterium sp. Leaf351]
PLVHERLEVELVAGHALLIRWPGLSSGAPLVLMAHQDVVPADPAEWTTPPFSPTVFGEGEDETIRARGAIDDKG